MTFKAEALPSMEAPILAGDLERQFRKVAEAIDLPLIFQFSESHVEPGKPRDGMVVLADGTDWDPGAGAGYYGYHSAAWNKLG